MNQQPCKHTDGACSGQHWGDWLGVKWWEEAAVAQIAALEAAITDADVALDAASSRVRQVGQQQ